MKFNLGQFVYDKNLGVYGIITFDEGDECNRLFIKSTKSKKSNEYIYVFEDIVEENLEIPVLDRISYPRLMKVVNDEMFYYNNIMVTDLDSGLKYKNDTMNNVKELVKVYESNIYNNIINSYTKVDNIDNKTYILVYNNLVNNKICKSYCIFRFFGKKLVEIPANNYRISVLPRNVVIKDMFNFDIEKIRLYYHDLPIYQGDVKDFNYYELIKLEDYIHNGKEFNECKFVKKLINLDVDIVEEIIENGKLGDSVSVYSIEIYEYDKDIFELPKTIKLLEFKDGDKYISVDTSAIEGDVPSLVLM